MVEKGKTWNLNIICAYPFAVVLGPGERPLERLQLLLFAADLALERRSRTPLVCERGQQTAEGNAELGAVDKVAVVAGAPLGGLGARAGGVFDDLLE